MQPVCVCAGVSQRDVTQYFPALADQQDDLAEALLAFHEESMQTSGFVLSDCTHPFFPTNLTRQPLVVPITSLRCRKPVLTLSLVCSPKPRART